MFRSSPRASTATRISWPTATTVSSSTPGGAAPIRWPALIDVMDPNIAQLVQAQSVAVDLDQLADRILTLAHDAAAAGAHGGARTGEGGPRVPLQRRHPRATRRSWDALAAEAARQAPAGGRREPVRLERRRDLCGLSDAHAARRRPSGRRSPPPSSTRRYAELRPLLDPAVLAAIVQRAGEPDRRSRASWPSPRRPSGAGSR